MPSLINYFGSLRFIWLTPSLPSYFGRLSFIRLTPSLISYFERLARYTKFSQLLWKTEILFYLVNATFCACVQP